MCGNRIYSISNSSNSSWFLKLNTSPTFSIDILSTQWNDYSPTLYTEIFTVALVNYPTISLTKTLTVTITECVITSITNSGGSNLVVGEQKDIYSTLLNITTFPM